MLGIKGVSPHAWLLVDLFSELAVVLLLFVSCAELGLTQAGCGSLDKRRAPLYQEAKAIDKSQRWDLNPWFALLPKFKTSAYILSNLLLRGSKHVRHLVQLAGA